MELTSTAFSSGQAIPQRYTCEGVNVSPPLHWDKVPPATQSFALMVDDPDAPMGTWDHWIIFNIPATIRELPEDIKKLPLGTKQGANGWNRANYNGPCPPDREHRYFFKLYALDTTLDQREGIDKSTLLKAMQNHVLAEATLIGIYGR